MMTGAKKILSIEEGAIAIIGMSGRFPGAKNISQLWSNLQAGVESIDFFSDEEIIGSGVEPALVKKPEYVKASGVLSDIDQFDAPFFDFSAKEAAITDPQHRLFTECAWEALENAGYDPQTYEGAIGVYAGVGMNGYLLNNLYAHQNLSDSASAYQLVLGNDKDFLPTRVSYKLNLKGPSVNVQTACSTSLVAVHLACQSLLNGECDMSLVGGASVRVPQKVGYLYLEGMIMSPDGHCRAFDAKARGTVGGSGVGIVVLKRLEDALADGDYIHGIIKGTAINNDGSEKVGYTAPSIEGQAAVIREAQGIAGIDPETITYIEAHGTGTAMGDPIEIAALTRAFRAGTEKKGFCAIGSVKTNVGHLDAAAGVTGLIKTVLALKHKLIPPSLHFETPNSEIDFANSPFYVNSQLSEWKTQEGTPRRAGVSSFGIGGTNAHVVLEEAPEATLSPPGRKYQLLVLSAKTNSALDRMTENYRTHLKQHRELNLADVAYTLSIGRMGFNHRRMLVCADIDEAVKALNSPEERAIASYQEGQTRSVVFMFSGQGSQYVNMGRELYETEQTFRSWVDRCCELLQPHLGLDLRDLLYPSEEVSNSEGSASLQETAIAQPALFVIEYALAQLWMSWGVRPVGAIGHSIGEYVAATMSGVFSLEDALTLVAVRGKLMQEMPIGSMVAVPLSEAELQPQLGTSLEIAAINGPSNCVLSGPTADIEALQKQLTQEGTECRRLHTSHAFHSQMMSPIIAPFTEKVKQVSLNPTQIPFISNVTGTWITVEQATDPNYWAKHLRQPVRFAEGLQHLGSDRSQILLEVGPGRTLRTLAKRHPDLADEQIVLTSIRHPQEERSDIDFVLNTCGQLWLAGVPVDWEVFYTHQQRRRLPLPTYPFERQRYWIELAKPKQRKFDQQLTREPNRISAQYPVSNPQDNLSSQNQTPIAPRNQLEEAIASIWQELLGNQQVGIYDNFFDLGGDSLVAVQVVSKLREKFHAELDQNLLLKAPTIAQLASSIAPISPTLDRQAIALAGPLVEMQAGDNSKKPLFLVHTGGGDLYYYRDLVSYLGSEQPVYGLQPLDVDIETEPSIEIEERAAKYIEAMRVLQPLGPYSIGGHSFGGTVAFEIAQQLQALDEKIAVLAMIDSFGPEQIIAKSEDSENGAFGNLTELNEKLFGKIDKDEKNISDALERYQMMGIAHANAIRNYIPRMYPGRIIFFRAREKEALAKYFRGRPESSWIDLAAGGIEIHAVPGNHWTMNYPPHVQVLASKLKVCLEQENQ